ncbi:hypothetical protein TGPRC2_310005 [Toxoplasma gondii TgCatPRC2]|uniref:Uncharacterized protein n=11 Tax=Toxoplasma gondii TaxID=5811 RepID=A0A125YQU2_TOXGV|nr:hypothetical protein TGME49_310005 [Toxoplasma gondii ME49]ESS34766.1 hypothetical protein TGVEG_310005 [Toxoplasma gondii VEG]KFG40761.1 hypothetical protein TGP89_310005 [Toxoplasma gondii p89]KFG44624.1 hypothetical protein TGDOM2_310005 [Toxoplasma gondii GAB2-2007-GAL-DOM2]KFG55758.1 hypothetical protein TGFOU_310005 [Toxoplasma gondii FOU]KFG65746.1 hypothetical protein TGRUB_310005 [Toxoplasma gondii RUB]KFH02444.1 hypothetical protein TGVAND_310005 [Toxoplasma gondii VAND]KYF47537|eukprot:XP_018635591.1 hypothetical protein TGME49_310005 [Toxoplasma gondii ME49]
MMVDPFVLYLSVSFLLDDGRSCATETVDGRGRKSGLMPSGIFRARGPTRSCHMRGMCKLDLRGLRCISRPVLPEETQKKLVFPVSSAHLHHLGMLVVFRPFLGSRQ